MATTQGKRYWQQPITLRLTAYQRKVLSEIVDGAADAGTAEGGLTASEQRALRSIFERLIGADQRALARREREHMDELRKNGCTCQCPEPEDGVAGVSFDCPIHG